MTKTEYLEMLWLAMSYFIKGALTDLEKEDPQRPIDEWNDEFMLELYEETKDKRRV